MPPPSLRSLAKCVRPLQERRQERWPSGLRRTLGKRVCGKLYRGFESHSLRHFYATALPSIRLFESTARPPKNSAILRYSSAQAVVFRRGFGGGFFRHYTFSPLPLFESTAKTIGGAIKAVAASRLIAAQTVPFGSRFGGWILRGRPAVTLPARVWPYVFRGNGQRVSQLPELLEASVRGHSRDALCAEHAWTANEYR
jgi:hypothetical protein